MKKIYFILIFSTVFFAGKSQVLLNEGFEGNTFPPSKWTLMNGNAPNGLSWTYNTDSSLNYDPYPAHGGNSSMVYEYDPAFAANAWAITPSLHLVAGISYSISFFYRVEDSDYAEKMKVTVGNAATIAAQNTILWNNNGSAELTNTSWQPGVIKYTPSTTGDFYFGFNCYSDSNKFALITDDIRVEVSPSAAPACTGGLLPGSNAVNVGVFPTTLSWKASAGATSYDLYLGTTLSTLTYFTNTNDTTTSFTGKFSTSYFWFVVPRNAAGTPFGCAASVTSFTTEAVPAVPVNDLACNAITLLLNGAGDCENTISATSTGDSSLTCSVANNTVWYKFTSTKGGPVAIKMKRSPGAELNLNGWIGLFTTTGSCPALKFTQQFNCYTANLAANDSVVIVTDILAPNTTYYIMVDGFSQSVGGFCISLAGLPAAPSCASIISPANEATNVNAPSVNFLWKEKPSTTGYTIFIGTTFPPKDDTINVTGDTSVILSPLAYNTKYYWSVVPANGGLSASNCSVYSFTTGADRTLPVNLSSFYGRPGVAGNDLFWTTETEQNSKGFELQRSSDGNNFHLLAFIPTKAINGNSIMRLTYSFSDNKPLPGNNYYRLLQTDKDGKSTVSKVVLLMNENRNELILLNIYPNPASSKINLSFSSLQNEKINIMITDIAGKVVMQQTNTLTVGNNKIAINTGRISSGNYLVKIINHDGSQTIVSRFLKQ